MAWFLLLALAFCGRAWELTVAFTTDLHTSLSRLEEFREIFAQADLVLDGGDAWEDPRRLTGPAEAWETMRRMAELGYTAMVLGNHETYLGPSLLREILSATPFPVLATNLRSPLPLKPWTLVETKGLRVLILGVLWDLAVVWPGWELLDPQSSLEETLSHAPPHDIFLLLGHLDTGRAFNLVQKLSKKPALFVLGHDHGIYEEPVYVNGVPVVQAGSRGKALGFLRLAPEGIKDYAVLQPRVIIPLAVPISTWLVLLAFLAVIGLWRG